MFHLTKVTTLIHMKSGKPIKLRCCKHVSFKSDNDSFTDYSFQGGGDFDIRLKEIEAVQIIQPLWIRVLNFIRY